MLKIEIVGDDTVHYSWEISFFNPKTDWEPQLDGTEKTLEAAASKAIQAFKILKERLK